MVDEFLGGLKAFGCPVMFCFDVSAALVQLMIEREVVGRSLESDQTKVGMV